MTIAERVKLIISDQLGVEQRDVIVSVSFKEDLGADSLDMVELIMAFEDEFGIEIPDESADKISNVREAIEYIQNNTDYQN